MVFLVLGGVFVCFFEGVICGGGGVGAGAQTSGFTHAKHILYH